MKKIQAERKISLRGARFRDSEEVGLSYWNVRVQRSIYGNK
jgi:hypothetical protein